MNNIFKLPGKIIAASILFFCFFLQAQELLPSLNLNKADISLNTIKTLLKSYESGKYNIDSPEMQAKRINYRTLRHEFESKLELAKERQMELTTIAESMDGRAPYLGGNIFRQLIDIQSSFNNITNIVNAFSEEQIAYNELKSARNLLDEYNRKPTINHRYNHVLSAIDDNLKERGKILAIIHDIQTKANTFSNELDKICKTQDKLFQNEFAHYTLLRESYIGNQLGSTFSEEIHQTGIEFNSFFNSLRTNAAVLLPFASDLYVFWITMSIIGLAELFFWLAIFRRIPREKKTFFVCIFFFIASIGFSFYVLNLPSASESLFSTLTAILGTTGVFTLSLALYKKQLNGKLHSMRMFWVFITNVLLVSFIDLLTSFLAYPRVILSVLLIGGLIMMLIYILNYRALMTAKLGGCCMVLIPGIGWGVSLVLAYAGFLYLGIIISCSAYIIGLILFNGSVLSTELLNWGRRNDDSMLRRNFVATILIPTVWLLLLSTGIIRVSSIINGYDMVMRLFQANIIAPSDFQVTIWLLVKIGISALIVKFFLYYVEYIVEILSAKHKYNHGSLYSLFLILSYVIWILFGLSALSLINFSWEQLKWILGGLSVGLGFALKDIMENFICGVILLLGKEVRLGDLIEYGDIIGQVERINIRATFISNSDGAVITLPNNQMVAKDFLNWTLKGNIIGRKLTVGVEYGSDIELVKKSLAEAAERCPKVNKTKPVQIFFSRFEASELLFTVRYWVNAYDRGSASSMFHETVNQVFEEKGIVIAFPQLSVHIIPEK